METDEKNGLTAGSDSASADQTSQPETASYSNVAVSGTTGQPEKVVIPDECGDSLWEDVLAQKTV